MGSVSYLPDLTWHEAKELAAAGAIAVVPTGAMEQHGSHLPLEVDSLIVGEVAGEGARRARKAIVGLCPTLWLGMSEHHTGFFALSIDSGAYIDTILGLINSLVRGGFGRILLLNGHGGNSAPLKVAVARARRSADAVVVAADYWALARTAIRAKRRSDRGGISHGGEMETSLVLHLKPEAVRLDAVRPHVPQWASPFLIRDLIEPSPVVLGMDWADLTQDGALGDPSKADAELGRELLQVIAVSMGALLDDMTAWVWKDGSLHLQ